MTVKIHALVADYDVEGEGPGILSALSSAAENAEKAAQELEKTAAVLRAWASEARCERPPAASDLRQSFDGQDWAREFSKVLGGLRIATPGEDGQRATGIANHDCLASWFANALQRGYDEHARRWAEVTSILTNPASWFDGIGGTALRANAIQRLQTEALKRHVDHQALTRYVQDERANEVSNRNLGLQMQLEVNKQAETARLHPLTVGGQLYQRPGFVESMNGVSTPIPTAAGGPFKPDR